jgi:predicted transcriptional regulator
MKHTCPTCGSETEKQYTSSSGLGARQLEILKYLSGGEPKTVLNIATTLNQSTTAVHGRVARLVSRGLLSKEDSNESWGFRSLAHIYTTTEEGEEASRIRRVSRPSRGLGLGKKQKEVISYLSREGKETIDNIASDLDHVKGSIGARLDRLVDKELVYKYSVGRSDKPITYVYKLSKRGIDVAKKIRAERVRRIRGGV